MAQLSSNRFPIKIRLLGSQCPTFLQSSAPQSTLEGPLVILQLIELPHVNRHFVPGGLAHYERIGEAIAP